jgi:hypothetical protein
MLALHLARFEVNVTPPAGHPLCGGWIKPVETVDDRLLLRGVILQGVGLPIVLAVLDWTGVLNESHRLWTERLADAAHTSPDRVALHCVHQHNAPFVDRDGNALLNKAGAKMLLFEDGFVDDLMARSAEVVRGSLEQAQPISALRAGKSVVREVASNRRILGPDGRVRITRYSATKDAEAKAASEGTIDPNLISLGFYQNDRPLARLYYYTTHPMSYYGDGRVTSDFVGLARAQRDSDEPGVHHVYFTGAAGNVTAGKYNEGTPADRVALTDRVHTAMAAADRDADDHIAPLDHLSWTTLSHRFEPRSDLDLDKLKAIVADPKQSVVNRNRTAMAYGWLTRVSSGRPILLSRLELGAATILHLPAESFVEYQLDAQRLRPGTLLATAAYGDGGPWYIPLARSFGEGGYEPSVALVHESSETAYRTAIESLLRSRPGE